MLITAKIGKIGEVHVIVNIREHSPHGASYRDAVGRTFSYACS